MKKLISKIKGIKCRIEQEEEPKVETNIFCYGDNECDTCCGLEICKCNDKLIKQKYDVEFF
jgi:hypothetical protein